MGGDVRLRVRTLLAVLLACIGPIFGTPPVAPAEGATADAQAATADAQAANADAQAANPDAQAANPDAQAANPGTQALAPGAQAATSATIAPSFLPYRLGGKSALTFSIAYTGGESGVPSPVRRSVLRFPAGLSLDIPSLHTCNPARLQALGPRGCSTEAQIGNGHALVEGYLGAQLVSENVTLTVFLGAPRNLEPIVEILAEGAKPISVQVVIVGTVLPYRPPYGEELAMSIPAFSTLPGGPEASMVDFSLTVGTHARHRARDATTVLVPAHCPAGGLPFAAEFTYADRSTSSAQATVPCPR